MIATVILGLESFYVLCGLMLGCVALRICADRTHARRWGSSAFWLLLALVFVFGKHVPSLVTGYALLAMVALAATGQVALPAVKPAGLAERLSEAGRLGNRLFVPALLVPIVTLCGARWLPGIHVGSVSLVDEKQATIVALGAGAVLGLVAGWRLLGARVVTPMQEGARLTEAVGWALILPQLLAALGALFQKAGVGTVVADLVARALPTQFPVVAVIAYCVAMALFTICLGNAFAAFAVITSGIGLPFIVHQHHGNAAIMGAIGMLSGYCGTLITPMAANFNIVPAMLLELDDRNAVIKAQLPIALALLCANIALMYLCVYRF